MDPLAGTLTIAGQVITVDNETIFDDSIPTRSLSGIVVGDRIEVHGFAGGTGPARATRIEKAGAGETEVEVTGVVKDLDATARRFTLGTLRVDYSTATLEDFGSSSLVAGQLVEVKGTSFLADGALRATRVEREDEDFAGASGDSSEVEGLVTRFGSATDFDVAGQRIITNGSTVYLNGTATDLKLNVKVEVEGTLDANGALVAAKVVFKRQSTARLAGPVESIDLANGTFRALGVTVVVSATTRREDHFSDDHFFGLDDLGVGDWVEVGGYADAAVAGRLIAMRLERDEAEDEVELRGPASDIGASSLRVLGVRVELLPGTEYEDEDASISAAEFRCAGGRAGGRSRRQLERHDAARGRGRDRGCRRRDGAAAGDTDAADGRWQPGAGGECRCLAYGTSTRCSRQPERHGQFRSGERGAELCLDPAGPGGQHGQPDECLGRAAELHGRSRGQLHRDIDRQRRRAELGAGGHHDHRADCRSRA